MVIRETVMGNLPTCQWAISPVTISGKVGTLPPMGELWRERLEREMKEQGFNMKSLSSRAGLGETFVRDALKRDRRPGVENLQKIAAVLNVSVSYLMGEDQPELVYEPLPEHDPRWREAADLPADKRSYTREYYRPSTPGAFPEIDVRLGAGEGAVGEVLNIPIGEERISGHAVVAEWLLPEEYIRSEVRAAPSHTLVLQVQGDSMAPTYQPGDRVLVDLAQNRWTEDTVYVMSDGYQPPQVKRLLHIPGKPDKIIMASDNPSVGRMELDRSAITIIGRVCGVISRR